MKYRDARNLRNKENPGKRTFEKWMLIIMTLVWLLVLFIIILTNQSCTSTQSMVRKNQSELRKYSNYHSTHYSKEYVGKYDTILVYATQYTKEQVAFMYLQNGNILPIELEDGKIEFEFNDPIYKEEDFAVYFPYNGKAGWQRDVWEAWVLTPKKVPRYRIKLH